MAADLKIRVLFLLQRAEGWCNIRSVWQAMAADVRFVPEVWVLPYDVRRTAEHSDRLAQATAALSSESVPYTVWTETRTSDVSSFDVVVFTTPYDLERPNSLHFDVVARQVPVTAYIPYGFVVGGGRKNRFLQFGQPTQMHATLVFARSWRERAMYRRNCPTGDAHVRVTGLPRLDELSGLHLEKPDPELAAAIGGRFAVLWNSHFSFGKRHVGSLNYSTFDRIGGNLLRYAVNNPEVALIWRPHPHLLPAMTAEGLLGPNQLAGLERDLRGAGIIFDRRADHRPAFVASNALLTDAGSFIFEYLATGKPMAFLHNPDGPGLTDEAEELVGHLDRVHDAQGAISFIERARHGHDHAGGASERILKSFLPMQDGRSASRVVESIAGAALSARQSRCSIPLGDDDFPVLSQLVRNLRELHDRRDRPLRWHRGILGAYHGIRDELTEGIKRRPWLYRILTRWRE